MATLESLAKGFKEGLEDESPISLSQAVTAIAAAVMGLTRVGLYGFLLAFDGVPLLPWGDAVAIAATLLAAVLGSIFLGDRARPQFLRFGAVALIFFGVLRFGEVPTTSILLVGAFMSAAAAAASNYPLIYGMTAGMAVGAVAVHVFAVDLFRATQLPLSQREWTSERAAAEALHLAGFMFLTALIKLVRQDSERMKQRAVDAEAARDAAIVDERSRIARELHDVVSHHVTAMTLQAEAAAITGDKQALTSVAGAGREALTELRRMLGVLRHAPGAEPDNAEMEPQPDLTQLDRLADRTTAGLEVRIDRRGEVRPLPAGVELCVYRLVQEALTNSAKHGDATAVDVVLIYAPDMITVDIRDNGKPLAAPRVRSGGLGLIGMQERVALLNGELSTGRRSDGTGYAVVARLPIAS